MSSASSSPHSGPYSTSSTPATGSKRKSLTPKKTFSPQARGARPFTAAMQDRQARNKKPYSSSDESEEGSWGSPEARTGYKDTYEQSQKRREAAVILDNPELLMMHAQARFDSIAGTRAYFTSLMAGYPPSQPYIPATSNSKSKSSRSHPKPQDQDRRRNAFPDLEDRWVDQAGAHSMMVEGGGGRAGEGTRGDEEDEWDAGSDGDD